MRRTLWRECHRLKGLRTLHGVSFCCSALGLMVVAEGKVSVMKSFCFFVWRVDDVVLGVMKYSFLGVC